MATNYKLLGQIFPAAGFTTELYSNSLFYNSASSSNRTMTSSIVIGNRGSSSSTFKIAVSPSSFAASAIPNQCFISFDTAIDANDTIFINTPIILEDHIVWASSTSGSVSFNLFGVQLS